MFISEVGEADYCENGLIQKDSQNNKTYKDRFRAFPVYKILDHIKKAPTDFSVGPDISNVSDSNLKVK